jgi:D-tyrosyl-tRNA(Tyr) deacylase
MRVVVQRSLEASCTVDGQVTGSIDHGLMILVGFDTEDTIDKLDWMVNKIVNLRIFEDENGKMNRSVLDENGAILCISQFTLYGDVKKGFRPSFTKSLNPNDANELFNEFNKRLSEKIKVEIGIFGAEMKIQFTNDGPVTIIIEK